MSSETSNVPNVILKDEGDFFAVTAWDEGSANTLRRLGVYEDTEAQPWHNPDVKFRGAVVGHGQRLRIVLACRQGGIDVAFA